MDEKGNPHDVRQGDIYKDMDTGRVQRFLKVEAIEHEEGVAALVNTKTGRTTRVRLDRLAARTKNSHGYMLVERAEAEGQKQRSAEAQKPDGAEARP